MNHNWAIVGLLIGGLLVVGGQAEAYLGDPLRLTGFGALVPFWNDEENKSFIEISSPVGPNDGTGGTSPIQLRFYDASCTLREDLVESLSTNKITVVDVSAQGIFVTSGLVAISAVGAARLSNPIHVRVHWVNLALGFERVVDPISVDDADCPEGGPCGGVTWVPFRTGGTFRAPLQDSNHQSTLYLVCPTSDLIAAMPQPKVAPSAFPLVVATQVATRVYDDQENLLDSFTTSCTCLTPLSLSSLSSAYSDAKLAPNGTYTELRGEVVIIRLPGPGQVLKGLTAPASFVGYLGTHRTETLLTGGSVALDAFGRISNAHGGSLSGTLPKPGSNRR